jgi:hypothetical protein
MRVNVSHSHNALNRARFGGTGVERAGWQCLTADRGEAVKVSIAMTPKRVAGGLFEGGVPFS